MTSYRTEKEKKDVLVRLNKIEGQIRGIKGMIEKEEHCDNILNQITAVQSALHGVSKALLEHHMKHCVTKRIEEGDYEAIEDLIKTFNKLLK